MIDFGLSTTPQEDDMETLLFSPPEVSKKAKDLGKSADIWALGVTFYYFMTGEYPWKGAQNPSQLRDKILNELIDFSAI